MVYPGAVVFGFCGSGSLGRAAQPAGARRGVARATSPRAAVRAQEGERERRRRTTPGKTDVIILGS